MRHVLLQTVLIDLDKKNKSYTNKLYKRDKTQKKIRSIKGGLGGQTCL